ncbi:MAG: alanine racemase [Alphaproteobacteria bacterium]
MDHSGFDTARLTVRLGAITANYRKFIDRCPTARVAAAVKADAYGLGLAPVTQALAEAGCDTFFVARLAEGMALRELQPNVRIFVLDGAPEGTPPALIVHRLIPVLNSLAEIERWAEASRAERARLDCAIHFDTGMNRLGLPAEERARLVADSRQLLGDMQVVLWMSHLACGDDCASPMNRVQLRRFREMLAALPPAPASLSASAGTLLGPDYHFDLVRPGIGLYGGNPCMDRPNPFAVVAVLTGGILQLQRVDTGETVGYGATFRVKRPSLLATIGLGYADGLMRAIGNRGEGAIGGVRVPVVGRVSMDLVTVDVTDVPAERLHVETHVEFLGDTISLDEFAARAGTASYEVLTSLGHRMPRHYGPPA